MTPFNALRFALGPFLGKLKIIYHPMILAALPINSEELGSNAEALQIDTACLRQHLYRLERLGYAKRTKRGKEATWQITTTGEELINHLQPKPKA